MSETPNQPVRRASPELVSVITLGVTILLTVLGQAVWLDGKIERVDARLSEQIGGVDARLSEQIDGVDVRLSEQIGGVDVRLSEQINGVDARLTVQIENLQLGQAAIRERLAALESRSASANNPLVAQSENPQPAS